MKIIFVVSQSRFCDEWAPGIHLLAATGHCVHLVADMELAASAPTTAHVQNVVQDLTRSMERLHGEFPNQITYAIAPSRRECLWLAKPLRQSLDAWRYLDPRYDGSPSFRQRALFRAPSLVVRLTRLRPLGRRFTRALSAIVRQLERAVPCDPSVEELLSREAPDALIVTPLIMFASSQVDYVRSARKLGIPSALAVGSWDYLTTKGAMYEQPDRVFVWNTAQRAEAHSLLDVPLDRIVVTGVPGYDAWLGRTPSRSRAEFCAQVGVDNDRPFLLYVCSSGFITPYEVGFVRRWIDAIRRSSDGELARTPCLIRPHPLHRYQWRHFDVSGLGAVRVWPSAEAAPQNSAFEDYYDSIYYSAAVVGVNTSALLEAGIVGRTVCSMLCDEFAGQQEYSFHFQHLKMITDGGVHVATTLEQHLAHLAEAVRHRIIGEAAGASALTEAVLRPHGIDMPVAPVVANAIESLASLQVLQSADPWWNRVLRPILFAAAAVVGALTVRRGALNDATTVR